MERPATDEGRMTHVRQRDEAARPAAEAGNYFVLCTREANWYVSTGMARTIESELQAAGADGWITFVDLTGARIRVRAGLIQYLAQCYAENRARERRFWRSHKAEAKAERDWDED
jgi:hypothetical protein